MATGGHDSEQLNREYLQWKKSKELLIILKERAACHRKLNGKGKAMEGRIYGRWLQTVQLYDWQQLDERYPLLPRQPLNDDRSKNELARMLKESFNMTADQAMELTDELLNMIHQFLTAEHEETDQPELQYEKDKKGGHIVVGEFRTPHCHRIKFLVKRFGLMSTALVSMRYEPLSQFKGGESGMSVTALNALHDIGQATHEGFASPLNCRLLGRDLVKFCSLFDDTDAAFGSLGSFFRIRLSDHPGGWILNPPFVEPVMEETARRVVDLLKEAEPGSFWFFIILPIWEENGYHDGYRMLDQCEWKVARIDFEKRSFVQQDSYGLCFTPNVRLAMFVIGQLPSGVDLVALRNRIGEADAASVEADWLVACGVVR